jgi:hypothetical protein
MGRAALEAEASRRTMICAISPEGFTHFIPDWFEELTMLNRAAADGLPWRRSPWVAKSQARRGRGRAEYPGGAGTDAQADARQVGTIKQVLSFEKLCDDAYT